MTSFLQNVEQTKLLEQVHGKARLKHYSICTEQAYLDLIKRFILHFDKRHPSEMGPVEVDVFLMYLEMGCYVVANKKNQAKSALLFLYKEVLGVELPWLDNLTQAKIPKRLPVVLAKEEVQALLNRVDGSMWLIASLLYGSGLRVMECLRLRVKDIDLARCKILVFEGKGFKDRVTMLPVSLIETLKQHLLKVQALITKI